MGIIGNIDIYFITVFACSFVCQFVNATIHIHINPYKPQILYLGRQNFLEDINIPYNTTNNGSIYAIVHDIYGKNYMDHYYIKSIMKRTGPNPFQ